MQALRKNFVLPLSSVSTDNKSDSESDSELYIVSEPSEKLNKRNKSRYNKPCYNKPRYNKPSHIVWYLLALIVALSNIGWTVSNSPSYCQVEPTSCIRIAYQKLVAVWPPLLPSQSTGLPPRSGDKKPFYGMQYVPNNALETVAGLGIDMLLNDFPLNGTPEQWIAQLDLAAEHNMKVVAWQWPTGWQWNEAAATWDIDSQARLFVETVADHPALFAVYATHEAYWNECYSCGYTTAELQMLYSQIKEIAEVPIYSAFGDYDFWRHYSADTIFADGVCDYCDVQYYPVQDSGYQLDEYIDRLALELATVRELAPNSKFVWVMQSFESAEAKKVMPNAEQMREIASIALETDVDGVWWYVWNFDESQYQDVLSKHPELFPVVREIYEEYIYEEPPPLSRRSYLPMLR